MAFEVLDHGRLRVAPRHLPWLRANGLDSFERIMAMPDGQVKRDFPGRRTSRIELPGGNGSTRAVYLKRYFPDYLSGTRRLLRRLGWPGARDEALEEGDAAAKIAALGIPTIDVVAVGHDHPDARAGRRSFVMTLELVGAEEGHRYAVRLGPRARRSLLRRVAGMARQLHEGGLVHKDLYLCHFMAAPAANPVDAPALFLIDLQRVTRPRGFFNRWRVKDLGALAYSCLKAGATWRDLAAAFRVYRGDRPPDASARRLVRQVIRRVNWLKTRTPRHDSDFEQLR